MRRYWKLIAITAVVVLTIGTFYVESSIAISKYPTFVMKKKGGDEEEVKQLTVYADFENRGNYVRAEITHEGTSYRGALSYIDMIQGMNKQPEITRFQKEYRNFMRGKHEQSNLFFEDNDLLAYASIDSSFSFAGNQQGNFTFEIEILNKDTKQKNNFYMAVPMQNKYDYIDVSGIQIFEDELKIITRNMFYSQGNHRDEMHVYTFDISTQQLINDEKINFEGVEQDENSWVEVSIITKDNETRLNKYIAFETAVITETETNAGEFDHQLKESELIIYNLETNKQEKLELPKEYQEGFRPELLSDSTIYFSERSDNGLEVIAYNLESQLIETKQTFDLKLTGNMSDNVMLKNDKIYIFSGTSVIIAETKTGEIVYEGSIELAESSADQKDYKFEISYLRID